jgi:hypothetical protein
MSSKSRRNPASTSSGHGALGMGGDPIDDPRDLESGREIRSEEDLEHEKGPVPGATGGHFDPTTGGSAGNETVGPMGNKGITGKIGR